jgi:hypothetical protein
MTSSAAAKGLTGDWYAERLAALPPDVQELLRHALAARGHPLHDSAGEVVGSIAAVLIDRETARPTWLAVERASRDQSLVGVPVAGLEPYGAHYRVPVQAKQIHSAPGVSLAGVRGSVEHDLCRHYGIPPTRGATRPDDRRATSSKAFQGPGWSGPAGWLPAPRGR